MKNRVDFISKVPSILSQPRDRATWHWPRLSSYHFMVHNRILPSSLDRSLQKTLLFQVKDFVPIRGFRNPFRKCSLSKQKNKQKRFAENLGYWPSSYHTKIILHTSVTLGLMNIPSFIFISGIYFFPATGSYFTNIIYREINLKNYFKWPYLVEKAV